MSKRRTEFLLFEDVPVKPEKKTPRTIVHRDVLKKRRDEQQESDTINKREIYVAVLEFKTLYKRIKKFNKIISKVKNEKKKIELKAEVLLCEKMKKKIYEEISFLYINASKLLTRHHHFNGYKPDFKYDMVMDAYTRSLNIGKEGKNNYGLPYFARFKFHKNVNVFSYWQQQSKNFFYQFIMKKYQYNNDMQIQLHRIIDQFQYDAINIYGQNHARFHLGTVTDDNND